MRTPKVSPTQVIGTVVCWRCHQGFTLYVGQRRRYCDGCVRSLEREGGAKRRGSQLAAKE